MSEEQKMALQAIGAAESYINTNLWDPRTVAGHERAPEAEAPTRRIDCSMDVIPRKK